MYLDGGWTAYRGWGAAAELSAMIGLAVLWGGVSVASIYAAAKISLTGIGLVINALNFSGYVGLFATTGLQVGLAATAAYYFLRDGGFQNRSFSIWKATVYTGVKAL